MKNIYILVLLMFALLVFWACSENLFGSSGTQGGSCDNKNLDCLQIEAEEFFRAGKYKESYKTYQKIVNTDSNRYADPKRSVGYFGMAKAGLWWDSVTIFNFMGLSKDNKNLDGSDPTEIAKFFQNELGVETQNRYLQGTKKADNALRELNRRDSLTELYYNFLDGKNDSLTREFRKKYDSLNKIEKFPLSDMKYRRMSLSIGHAVSALLRTILGSVIFDLLGNECIFNFSDPSRASNDPDYGCKHPLKIIKLDMVSIFTFDENGMIQVDLLKIYEELVSDTNLVNALNTRFEDLTGDIGELIDLVGSITGGGYESGEGEISQDSLQKQLNDFKDYALFVRLNDKIDNDGDGCVNEELAVNGKAYDVDGDGFYGEDLRIISVPPFNAWMGCDKNKCFSPTNPSSGEFYPNHTPGKQDDYFIMYIKPNEEGGIDTIVRAAWSIEPGFWAEEFSNIEDGMARNEFKKEIQVEKDKNGKTRCWSLAERKRRLGGCWNNYSNDDFIKYRNNRLQTEKGGMNPECKGI